MLALDFSARAIDARPAQSPHHMGYTQVLLKVIHTSQSARYGGFSVPNCKRPAMLGARQNL